MTISRVFHLVLGMFVVLATSLAEVVGDDYLPFGEAQFDDQADGAATLRVPVRFAEPSLADGATFQAKTGGELELTQRFEVFSETQNRSAAYLFLIDVSDFAARRPAIDKMMASVEEILKRAESHHQVGVAVFAANLKVVAPIGTPHAALIDKMRAVEEGDLSTLLYGSAVKALDQLGDFPADRRALVLMSDGKAEDPVVSHLDVIKRAREDHIAVYSLGYVARAQDKKNLQGMQLIADATGGPFVAANTGDSEGGYLLMPEFVGNFYRYLENAGQLVVSTGDLHGEQSIQLTAATATGKSFYSTIKHEFPPVPKPEPEPVPPVEEKAAQPTPGSDDEGKEMEEGEGEANETDSGEAATDSGSGGEQADDGEADGESAGEEAEESGLVDKLLDFWWLILLGVLFFLFVLAIAVGAKRQRLADMQEQQSRDDDSGFPGPVAPGVVSLGSLETLDEPIARFPIVSSAVRIGRGQDNDIRLANDSVSKHHAEIQVNRSGEFHIIDLNSGNGVYVNGNRVSDAAIHDGDVIELGDIRLRLAIDR